MTWAFGSAGIAALAWGCSDFLAGMLARRLPVMTVLIWSKIAAAVLALMVVAARGTMPPADPHLLLAVVAGVSGLPAMGLLYRAMRDGSVAVVAPVAAVAALVPVAWGLLHGERFGTLGVVGVGAALIGVTLASWPATGASSNPVRLATTLCALGAALGFGIYFVLLHEASAVDPYWATAVARISGGVGAVILAVARGRRTRPVVRVPLAVYAVGVLDAVADAAFVAAAGDGAVGLAAMLASLYPAITVLLNTSLLRERLHTVHLCGVVTALLGVACLAT